MLILLVLFIYTVAVLFFVDLKKIGHAQDKVRSTIRSWVDKIK